jgi:hypothetical protein
MEWRFANFFQPIRDNHDAIPNSDRNHRVNAVETARASGADSGASFRSGQRSKLMSSIDSNDMKSFVSMVPFLQKSCELRACHSLVTASLLSSIPSSQGYKWEKQPLTNAHRWQAKCQHPEHRTDCQRLRFEITMPTTRNG